MAWRHIYSQASSEILIMRFSYVLLVASVTALLVPSAAVGLKPIVASMASPEQVPVAGNEANVRRLLRGHESIDDLKEERLSDAKFLNMLTGGESALRKWANRGLSVESFSAKLANHLNHGLTNAQFSSIVNRYRSLVG
ncbi:unnamed protein product [Phytophthora fragariaefolia]|uniref:RxLR effector protein n=1 Tax=Phytophthora fragariaefolia TaxID=1490495 RepID=A0A9W7CVN2_9STRA|nr:unnamed protein product [Phytophthora fragariaefolia]